MTELDANLMRHTTDGAKTLEEAFGCDLDQLYITNQYGKIVQHPLKERIISRVGSLVGSKGKPIPLALLDSLNASPLGKILAFLRRR